MPLDPVIARGLNPIGSDLPQVAQLLDSRARWNQLQSYQQKRDTAADAHQATADARETTRFNQERQVANTKLLAAASAEIAQNPAAAERWIPQLKQAGIIRADFDLAAIAPEQLQAAAAELYKSTSTALAAMNPQPERGVGTLHQITDETGNPVLATGEQAVGKRPYIKPDKPDRLDPTADERDFRRYKAMSEEDRKLEDRRKGRSDKADDVEMFESADTNAIRGLVTTAFGGLYDPITGNISGIKREDARNLNRVTARASQAFAASPGMSHAEAVEQAFAELQAPPAPAPARPGSAPAAGRGAPKPAQQGLPPQAAAKLKPGVVTTFGNGERWTVRDGKAVRVP